MTQTQYTTIVTLLRQLDARVEHLAERMAYVYPTEREMSEQLDREVNAILSPGASLKVFDDD